MRTPGVEHRARPLTAGAVVRRLRSWLPLGVHRRLMYLKKHRRPLRLRHPVTFTEKVNWRIVYDRRPLLLPTCDKLAMKDFAVSRVPTVRVPATLWSGTDVSDLTGTSLPERWVLKPNHRCGLVHFGAGATDSGELTPVVAGWLSETQAQELGEWAYSQARPLLLAEEFIGDGSQAPTDYKFFVFDGVVRLVQVDSSRFGGHVQRLYSPDWQPHDYTMNYPLGPVTEPPLSYARMLDVASALGAGYDFLRVDLYDVAGEVWFGEITPYPSGGRTVLLPRAADEALGRLWQLPPRRAVAGST